MKSIILWFVIITGSYLFGFYSGLEYRGTEDQDEALRMHIKELKEKAKRKGVKLIDVIREE